MAVMCLMVCLLVGLVVVQLWFSARRQKLTTATWESTLSRVEEVNLAGLQEIANLYLQPDKNQLRIEPNEMWKILGGFRGLRRLQSNADAMLTLASFAERWDATDGKVVSEFMRRDASRLRKAVWQVELSLVYGFGSVRAPFAMQEAIAVYILMRLRLLGLYEVAHVARIPLLEAAL